MATFALDENGIAEVSLGGVDIGEGVISPALTLHIRNNGDEQFPGATYHYISSQDVKAYDNASTTIRRKKGKKVIFAAFPAKAVELSPFRGHPVFTKGRYSYTIQWFVYHHATKDRAGYYSSHKQKGTFTLA